MKLKELDPEWMVKDGKRVGFTFRSPTNPAWRQACTTTKLTQREQWALFGDKAKNTQTGGCEWGIEGGIETASFDTITVKPSIDGSGAGLWHGFITNGEIR